VARGTYELATLIRAVGGGFLADDDGQLLWARSRFQAFDVELMTLDGREGNDWIYASKPEIPTALASAFAGNDTWGISYDARPQGADLLLQILGGDGSNVLYGTAGDDVVLGGSGADYIRGIA